MTLLISFQVVEKHEVIFIVTKLSYIHVCQLKNGRYVGSNRISRFRTTASILRADKSGIVLIDANGTVHYFEKFFGIRVHSKNKCGI